MRGFKKKKKIWGRSSRQKMEQGGQAIWLERPTGRWKRLRGFKKKKIWGRSSIWLERRPVTAEVAGSSPVDPAQEREV